MLAQSSGRKAIVGAPLLRMVWLVPWCRLRYQPLAGIPVATSVTGGTEPLGYVRDHFDADASFTPIPFTAFRVGYTREEETRTHRYFEKTTDNVLRGTIDLTGNAFLSVRTIYEHSRRTGNGLDEQVLDDIGEQISLRQFDISDRDRDRVSAVIQVTPINQLGVTRGQLEAAPQVIRRKT